MVKHEIKKITAYEYWPFWVFYIPMVPVWLYFALRTRSLTYFTAVNPGMAYGGFFKYSKYALQEYIPAAFQPQHFWVDKETVQPPFAFPFIAKPDMGERGKNVQLIRSLTEWEKYQSNNPKPFMVQEFIDYPLEFGVFFIKNPPEEKGSLLSITGKRFLTYQGDGKTSLREFIESDARAYFNKSYLYMKFHDRLDVILPKNQDMLLEEIGNHNRGTYFFDACELNAPLLTEKINEAVAQIPGFFYGRLDVKTTSMEDFKNGHFKVVEVNGANSEPTHIYDKKYTLFDAYKIVLKHLQAQYKIARINMKKGAKPTSLIEFVQVLYRYLFTESMS